MLQFGFSRKASEFFAEEVIPALNGEDDLGIRENQILWASNMCRIPLINVSIAATGAREIAQWPQRGTRGTGWGVRLGRWPGKRILVSICRVGLGQGQASLRAWTLGLGRRTRIRREVNEHYVGAKVYRLWSGRALSEWTRHFVMQADRQCGS